MIAKYVALSEADLDTLCADPDLAPDLFLSSRRASAPGGMVRAQPGFMAPQILSRLLPRLDAAARERLEAQMKTLTGMSIDEYMARTGQPAATSRKAQSHDDGGEARIKPLAQLSLDKAWHGVHYLLCGRAEEAPGDLAKAVMGGRILGSDPEGFSGYGPARYFKPADVDVISAALNDPDVARTAEARFDPDKMDALHIYPGWDNEEDEDKDWVMDALTDLCGFFADASRDRLAVVTCIV